MGCFRVSDSHPLTCVPVPWPLCTRSLPGHAGRAASLQQRLGCGPSSGCANKTPRAWGSDSGRLFLTVLEAEVPNQGTGRLELWWGPAPWFPGGRLLSETPRGRRGGYGTIGGLRYKGTNLIHEASALMTYSPPKGRTSNTTTLGVRI